MSHSRATGIAIVVAVAAVGVGVWRYYALTNRDALRRDTARETRAAITKSAQEYYRQLEPTSVPVDQLSSGPDAWAEVIARSLGGSQDQDVGPLHEALLAESAEFLWARFGQQDRDVYIRWRQSRDYRLQRDEVLRAMRIGDWYEAATGSPVPDGASSLDLFRVLISATPVGFDGSQIPTLLAQESGAASLEFQESNLEHSPQFPFLPDNEAGVSWSNGQSYTFAQWWLPERSYGSLVQSRGSVLLATQGLVLKFDSGDWRALVLYWQFDPVAKRWDLVQLAQNNSVIPAHQIASLDY